MYNWFVLHYFLRIYLIIVIEIHYIITITWFRDFSSAYFMYSDFIKHKKTQIEFSNNMYVNLRFLVGFALLDL
jgi:hypothetical protein